MPDSPTETELLVGRIHDWDTAFRDGDFQKRLHYLLEVNHRYDALANNACAEVLVELRLLRSHWAKNLAQKMVERIAHSNSMGLGHACMLLAALRTLIRRESVKCLLKRQKEIGDSASRDAMMRLLAEHALSEEARLGLRELNAPKELLRRLGPERIPKFRPSRKTGNFDHSRWLTMPELTELEFVNGDPDRIRIRGIELHSGDIGIVELNHPGDGLLESFLVQPGIAPHAMLYVTRRAKKPKSNEVLYQPSVIEIYEGGWRCVPITTALHPEFSWYSEWVRPKIDGQNLRSDIGEALSAAIDTMEVFSFDFQARRAPKGGYYSREIGGPCASCTNLIRVPYERAGIDNLPYPVTKLVPNAAKNLSILGIPEIPGIHTPTNILNDSRFEKIGIVDNGLPELGYAQALVVGRPELQDTFGGWMSQKELLLENLPNWKSVKNWKSAWEALRIRIGQSESKMGHAIRQFMNVHDDEVPKSVSDTTIAFYVRSDMEAGHIILNRVYPAVAALLNSSHDLPTLSQLRKNQTLTEWVRQGLDESALKKENWYR
ncbi:MAG: hypothetical protein NTY15_00275 [Planctomycetota bacterium]|nr:hypothetical protein [Planctomycetota bacterium]